MPRVLNHDCATVLHSYVILLQANDIDLGCMCGRKFKPEKDSIEARMHAAFDRNHLGEMVTTEAMVLENWVPL